MRYSHSFVLLLVAGCAPLGDIPDVPVTSATLVNLDTNTFAVVIGPVGGDAWLSYDSPAGGGVIPVAVSGGTLGAVFDMSIDLNPNADVHLDLSEADPDLRLPDLFGYYSGSGWSVTLALGGGGHTLRNEAGVRLSDEHFSAGVGMYGGFEWLRIREGGHEDGEDDLWDDTEDSADTSDTADSADSSDSSDSSDSGDSVPDDTDTDPPSTSGCGDASGCDGDGGDCECAVAGAPPPLLVTALAVTLLRRRSRSGSAAPRA